MRPLPPIRSVAIACGGTGGHLFPGMAVADALRQKDCEVTLLVSPKEVDQNAIKSASDFRIETIPAIALQNRALFAFCRGFWKSYRKCRARFKQQLPDAVLAMGGFTSAPPILAARNCGAATFLHESNAIPGRANRWLSLVADEVFVGFAAAARGLLTQAVRVTGTPVRPQFEPSDPAGCRSVLGLDPSRPVALIMGGSQGAHGINELVLRSLPLLLQRTPQLQFIHLTGPADKERVEAGYLANQCRALVRPFLTEMEMALGAATVAVGRAGASSLAELAAMRLPAILIPFPWAAGNHQYHNARAFVDTGAAKLLEEASASSEVFSQHLVELIENESSRIAMSRALERWDSPNAAEKIAERICETITEREPKTRASSRQARYDQAGSEITIAEMKDKSNPPRVEQCLAMSHR